jgi:RNA polymerase sigma factor (sigma-70 family)
LGEEIEAVTFLSPEANTQLEKAETRDMVQASLDKLPPKLKTAVLLTKFEGKSTREVSELEGVSEVAMRKRLSRAYKALEKELAKDWEMYFDQ